MTTRVSVVMANYNGAAYIGEAVSSVLAQSVPSLQVVVADDASHDDSLAILRRLAAEDRRITVLETSQNAGPGAARNRALAASTGEWVAIVDTDDVIAPDRLERLIALAEAEGADAVADDLVYFGDPQTEGTTLMSGYSRSTPWELTAEEFMRSHLARLRLPSLGYLKPVFRRTALGDLRYDDSVRIGEDSDFLLRFLLAGNRMMLSPDALYRYRRHGGSISHRWSPEVIGAMLANARALMAKIPADRPELSAMMAERCAAMEESLAFETMVADLKRRRLLPAMGAMITRPRLASRLVRSVREGLQRRRVAVQ